MDWDRLLKRVVDEDFHGSESEWIPDVVKFVTDYMLDVTQKKERIAERSNKIAELKRMIKLVFDLPDAVIEMMQSNVEKMEMTEIDDYIAQYKLKYENMKAQQRSKVSSSAPSDVSDVQRMAQPETDVKLLLMSEKQEFDKMMFEYYSEVLKTMSNGERFNFQKQWFINAITLIKMNEEEISKQK